MADSGLLGRAVRLQGRVEETLPEGHNMQAIHRAGGARPTITLLRTLKIQFPADNILLLKKKKKKKYIKLNKCLRNTEKIFIFIQVQQLLSHIFNMNDVCGKNLGAAG